MNRGAEMKYYDLHVHTNFSDGEASFEELVAKAKQKGYGLGVTDHVFVDGHNDTPEKLEKYLNYVSNKGVLVGVEANIGQNQAIPDYLNDKVDYVVSSMHYLKNEKEYIPIGPYFCYKCGMWDHYDINYDVNRTNEYLDWIYKEMKWTMENMRIDILGHPTVNPMHEYGKDRAFIETWDDKVIDLCISHNVAIEISNMWDQPDEKFIEKALEKGAMFSMASDGHKKNEICELDYPIAMAAKLAIPENRFFVPKKK